jgi:4-amino-4-deoxy-L-arabinose transferase-like glycosyltransferase
MIKIIPVPLYFALQPGLDAALLAYMLLIPIFCLYLFLLTRELFGNEEYGLIAVLITCSFPLTYGMWRNVMSEFGTTVALVGALYHLVRSDELRVRKHVLLLGLFLGWGLLWKISFPFFVAGPLMYVLIRRFQGFRPNVRSLSVSLAILVLPVVILTGPFYAKSGRDVLAFAVFSSKHNEYNARWSLGRVWSFKTVGSYWLSTINWNLSFYVCASLFAVVLIHILSRHQRRFTDQFRFLSLWALPPCFFFSFQLLKESRHLMPAYPAFGIAGAVLLINVLHNVSRPIKIAILASAMACSILQFTILSFDVDWLPRKDVHLGPFILSVKDLELASLQLMPTYTYPANRVRWPSREIVDLISGHSADIQGRLPRVRVVGDNPYVSGVVLRYQSLIDSHPIVAHGPWIKDDLTSWDFLVVLCGPEGRYGPMDTRDPAAEAALTSGQLPFREIGRVELPTHCDAVLYKKE